MLDIEEFEKLSLQNLSRDEYCGRILQRLVEVTGARAATIWNCSQSPYQRAHRQTNGNDPKLNISEADHNKIMDKVLDEQRGLLLRPDQRSENAHTAPIILLAPIRNSNREVIEMVIAANEQRAEDQDLMNALETAARLAGAATDESGQLRPRSISIQRFSSYVQKIHESLDKRATWSNIANESRLLLDCDRVTLAVRQRGRFRIVSISGQPSVNHRSNSVQWMEKLANRVLKTKTDFWYPSENDIAPQLKEILETYLVNNATRSLVIQPVFEKSEKLIDDPESLESKHNPVIAGLIFEHCNEQWDQAEIEPALQFVVEHAAGALRNTKRHTDLFLYSLWNLLGKSRILMAPRMLPKTLLIASALIVASLLLTFYKVPFYVSANGVLVPQDRHWVFAGQNGEVDEIFVEHGSSVSKDAPLLKLESRDLAVQLAETQGRISVLLERKQVVENRSFLEDNRGDEQAVDDNLDSIVAEIEALQEKTALLKELQANTTICSPLDGQVITWDVAQKLQGRSVRADQQLLEIANVDGPWVLELDIEDRRIGTLLQGFQQSNDQELKVKFTLAADPNQTYEGQLVEISNAIQLSTNNTQIVRAKVRLDENMIPLRQAKTGVTAKIYCGYETSIGFLWLHDVGDAFNRYVYFYFAN